jgi:hypothetical protein
MVRIAAVAAVSFCMPRLSPLGAQSVVERMAQRAKERAAAVAERAADKGFDRLENRIHYLVGDEECIAKAKKAGKTVTTHESTDELDAAVHAEAEAAAAAKAGATKDGPSKPPTATAPQPSGGASLSAADAKAWENFDFVPGERILFSDDLGRDRVGNFPQRLQLVEGNMQVVEYRGARWLQATSFGRFQVNLPEDLPRMYDKPHEKDWVDFIGENLHYELSGQFLGLKLTAQSVEFEAWAFGPAAKIKIDFVDEKVDTYLGLKAKWDVGIKVGGAQLGGTAEAEFAGRTASWDFSNGKYCEGYSAPQAQLTGKMKAGNFSLSADGSMRWERA